MSDERPERNLTPDPADVERRLDVTGEVLPLMLPRLHEIAWTDMRLRHILRELDLMSRNDRYRAERGGTVGPDPSGM